MRTYRYCFVVACNPHPFLPLQTFVAKAKERVADFVKSCQEKKQLMHLMMDIWSKGKKSVFCIMLTGYEEVGGLVRKVELVADLHDVSYLSHTSELLVSLIQKTMDQLGLLPSDIKCVTTDGGLC